VSSTFSYRTILDLYLYHFVSFHSRPRGIYKRSCLYQ